MQTNEDLRDEMHFEQQFKPSQIRLLYFWWFYNMKTVKATEFPRIQLFMKVILEQVIWKQILKLISNVNAQSSDSRIPTDISFGW